MTTKNKEQELTKQDKEIEELKYNYNQLEDFCLAMRDTLISVVKLNDKLNEKIDILTESFESLWNYIKTNDENDSKHRNNLISALESFLDKNVK